MPVDREDLLEVYRILDAGSSIIGIGEFSLWDSRWNYRKRVSARWYDRVVTRDRRLCKTPKALIKPEIARVPRTPPVASRPQFYSFLFFFFLKQQTERCVINASWCRLYDTQITRNTDFPLANNGEERVPCFCFWILSRDTRRMIIEK